MERYRRSILVLAICVQMLVIQSARAQWVENGVPLGNQFGSGGCYPRITTDGDGGAIVLLVAGYACGGGTIQRIDKYGALCWGEGRAAGGGLITTDLNGGAIFIMSSGTTIRGQRFDHFGWIQWPADGVPLCVAPGGGYVPQIVSDGFGGAIAVWEDGRGGDSDIYAQRIDFGGNVRWSTDGAVVCAATSIQEFPVMATTGSNAVVVAWLDNRNGIGWQGRGYELYAQKMDNEGNALWTHNGVPVRLGVEIYTWQGPAVTTDGAGGAIVAWMEMGWGNCPVLHAQRIDQDGNMAWPTDGAVVCDTVPASRGQTAIAPDGVGGAFITWQELHPGSSSYDIYAQRVSSTGGCLWAEDGVPVCAENNGQEGPKIVPDAQEGIIVTWADGRIPGSTDGSMDIYAQRIDAFGQVQWDTNGVSICGSQSAHPSIDVTSDGSGGVIAAWIDTRNAAAGTYAMRLDQDGNAPPSGIENVPVSWSLSQNYPNPFNPSTTISFTLPQRMTARLAIYNVEGKLVQTLLDGSLEEGYREVPWDGKDTRGGEVSSGVYFYRLTAGDRTLTKKMILLK
jgi:hypothetical protein